MNDVDELAERARSALEAGNTLVARGYWRRAARLAPDRLDLWTDLCRVTELPGERRRCLERIVELDPGNIEAQAELAQLRQDQVLAAEATEGEALEGEEGGEQEVAQAEDAAAGELGMRLGITDEMRRQWDEAVAAGKPLFCIDHPQRETVLRCNRCGAPVCTQCVVRTPVGFRCKECIKAQQASFYNAQWYDYPLAALLSLLLSVPAAVVVSLVGWWFALIISPFAGGLIGGIVHRAVGRRRGRWIWLTVAVCVVVGALAAWGVRPRAFLPIVIYAVAATGTAVGILRLGRSR